MTKENEISMNYKEMLYMVQKFHDNHDFKNTGGEDPLLRIALMAEELGELSACITKGKSQKETSEELADIFILCIGTAISLSVDLELEFLMKVEKINKRKSKIVNGKIRVSEFK